MLGPYREELNRFRDQPRTQAASADTDPLVAFADDGSHCLNIRIKHAPGLVIRMADVVSRHRLFLANFTHKRHDGTPSR